MTPANITRASAQERSRIITAEHYLVTVDLSGLNLEGEPLADPDTFLSTSEITFTSTGGTSHVDLIADEVLEAWIDDEHEVDTSAFADGKLPFTTEAGQHKMVIVALCRYSHTGEGLHRFVDPADGKVYLYSQFESADARRMYANFEQPDQKATFKLNVIAPKALAGGHQCTGRRTPGGRQWPGHLGVRAHAADEHLHHGAGGRRVPPRRAHHHVEGRRDPRLRDVSAVHEGICTGRRAHHAPPRSAASTSEECFGYLYPFGSYDQIFVPEFNAGAMENAGCVTFRDEYLFRSRVGQEMYEARDNTILHELAHMWFGDLSP